MDAEELLTEITSGEELRVRKSSLKIIEMSQDRERIIPLVASLQKIRNETQGLDLRAGMGFKTSSLDFALRVIEFHRDNSCCPCSLYLERGLDPRYEENRKNIEISETLHVENTWAYLYSVSCVKCSQTYKVEVLYYHTTMWKWSKT